MWRDATSNSCNRHWIRLLSRYNRLLMLNSHHLDPFSNTFLYFDCHFMCSSWQRRKSWPSHSLPCAKVLTFLTPIKAARGGHTSIPEIDKPPSRSCHPKEDENSYLHNKRYWNQQPWSIELRTYDPWHALPWQLRLNRKLRMENPSKLEIYSTEAWPSYKYVRPNRIHMMVLYCRLIIWQA